VASRRLIRAAGSLACAATLSGCVAAAIPVAAGGAMLRTSTQGTVRVSKTAETPPIKTAEAASAQDAARDTQSIFPGPVPVPGQRSATAEDAIDAGFSEFLAYAQRSATTPEGTVPKRSALLADPASLGEERKPCPDGPSAVLIDLDPPGAVLPREPVLRASAQLATRLANLRQTGIEIAWISARSATYAGGMRKALAESGLDPEGRDTLLLMRYPDDRKQTRRQDLGKRTCLLAIAGDEREDFDELYAFLVKPEAALRLELLIGDGWFLVPPLALPDQRPKP
jgi:hypothetical protein